MKKPVVLRIYKGEQLQGVKQFVDPQIVIGHPSGTGEVQLGLEGDSVSIIHASIEERDGTYFVSDLGSASGTFKNGRSVLDEAIESGDTLNIGDYKIEFYIGAPKPKSSGAPAAKSLSTDVPPTSVPPPLPANIFDVIEKPAVKEPVSGVVPEPASVPEVVAQPASSAVVPVAPSPIKPVNNPILNIERPIKTEVQGPPKRPAPPPIVPRTSSSSGSSSSINAANANQKPSGPTPAAIRPVEAAGRNSERGGTVSPGPVSSGGGLVTPGPSGGTLVGPKTDFRAHGRGRTSGSHKKSRKTFAPPSKYSDVKDYVKPSKGTVVEVLVVWGSRVISNHHFSQSQTVTVGSHPDNDIIVPLLSSQVRKLPILKIEGKAIVLITPEMRGEVTRGQTSSSFAELMRQNRMARVGNSFSIGLEQGEMARIEITAELAVMIRYVSDSPKPLVAPILDLTASETTGVILALALVSTLWLYMYLYSPPKPLEDQEEKQPDRTAIILLAPPTPPPLPPPPPPTPVPPVATPVPTPVATPPPQKVKVAEKVQEAQKKTAPAVTNLTKKVDPGKSASAAPNKNKTGPRIQTSVKQGGAIKTTPKEGAQMQSKSKDVSHAGMFSVFGNNGAQDKLAQSTTGAGELAGMANAANGKAGSAVDRAGQGLGSELKDTGMGGNGKALDGIAGGVGTQGRGSGNSGYGTGGLGNRQGVKIVTGGAGEDIRGTIDREAIRRVIRANLSSIRACYEKELNRHPDLMGKIVLTWEIGEQGRVISASTKSNELGNKEVADCITEKLKTWRFPEPPANTTAEVSYPFLFSN